MGKPRDLANVVATGNILADGAVAPAELTGVNATAAELNILDGVTATAAELNLMDGVTATTAELNHVDGVTSNVQTQMDTKAPVANPTFTGTATAPTINASTALQIGGTAITATAAELNIMDGVTASTSDINGVAGINSNVQTQLNLKAPIDGATFTGTTTIPTADINGGAIDGAIIGANSAAAVTATTVNASTKLQVNGTDVITNARQLSNIASVDSTTVAALATAGVGGGGGEFDAVAAGAITAGDAVYLKGDGKVDSISNSHTAQAVGSPDQLLNQTPKAGQVIWYSNTRVGFLWNDAGNKVRMKIYTVSGTSLSSAGDTNISDSYASGTEGVATGTNGQGSDVDYVVAAYRDNHAQEKISLISRSNNTPSVQASNNNLSLGNSTSATRVVYCPNDNCWLVVFRNGNLGNALKVTRSGNSMTVSSALQVAQSKFSGETCGLTYDPDIGRAILVTNNGYQVFGNVIDVSGTNPTLATNTNQLIVNVSDEAGYNSSPERFDAHYDTVNDRMIVFGSGNGGQPPFYAISKASTNGTFTKHNVSYLGAASGLTNVDTTYDNDVHGSDYNSTLGCLSFLSTGNFNGNTVSQNRLWIMYLKADGLNFTDPIFADGFGNDGSEDVRYSGEKAYKGVQFSDEGKVGLLYKGDSSNDAKGLVYQPTLTKAFDYIGLAGESISSSSTGKINVLGGVNENQSSLSITSDLYVQSNGSLATTDIGFGFVGKAIAATKILIKG